MQSNQNIQDMPPFVTFETRPVEDRAVELSKGSYGFKDVIFAKITRPGQRDTVEKNAEQWVSEVEKKSRDGGCPANWGGHFRAMLVAFQKGEEIPLEGTPLRAWPLLTPAEGKTLSAIGFRTVEELAGASDEAVQKIGIGGTALKAKAVHWVDESRNKGASVSRVSALEVENGALKQTVQGLLLEMAELKKRLPPPPAKVA